MRVVHFRLHPRSDGLRQDGGGTMQISIGLWGSRVTERNRSRRKSKDIFCFGTGVGWFREERPRLSRSGQQGLVGIKYDLACAGRRR